MLPTEVLARIDLLVLDVDGVLTDGRVTYSDDGREIKSFHVRDGLALRSWHNAGKQSAIISGRSSPTVARRAAELGIQWIVQGAGDKLPAFRKLLAALGREPGTVCVIGDDLPDLPLVHNCAFGVAVADGCAELKAVAHHVTRQPGGHGAVREVIEILLKSQQQWQPLVERLMAERF